MLCACTNNVTKNPTIIYKYNVQINQYYKNGLKTNNVEDRLKNI